VDNADEQSTMNDGMATSRFLIEWEYPEAGSWRQARGKVPDRDRGSAASQRQLLFLSMLGIDKADRIGSPGNEAPQMRAVAEAERVARAHRKLRVR
jgi:hypothetical protein